MPLACAMRYEDLVAQTETRSELAVTAVLPASPGSQGIRRMGSTLGGDSLRSSRPQGFSVSGSALAAGHSRRASDVTDRWLAPLRSERLRTSYPARSGRMPGVPRRRPTGDGRRGLFCLL